MELFERLSQFADLAIGRLRVGSALDSALYLCIVVMFFSLVGMWAFPDLRLLFLVLIAMPIVTCCFSYLYFVINAPEKLRSENFELRKVALGLIEEKGGGMPVSETSVEAISNIDYIPNKQIGSK